MVDRLRPVTVEGVGPEKGDEKRGVSRDSENHRDRHDVAVAIEKASERRPREEEEEEEEEEKRRG